MEPNVVHQKCKSCGEIVPFLVPEQARIHDPCRCGLTEGARVAQAWARAAIYVGVVVLISLFGGCWVNHYYTTEQIKALPDNRRPVKKEPGTTFLNENEFRVVTDVDPSKPVPPKPPDPPKK